MQPEPITFAGDVAACRALLADGSNSFALAARMLPPRVRDAATVLYAFCRVAADRIDADPHASAATVAKLRARLDRLYAGAPDDDPVDRALAIVVAGEELPRAPLDALLEGLAWDAEGRRYHSLADLHGYAARVAGAVGVLMSLLMGRRDPRTLARAAELGLAMQLTSIARDVGEDARRGRVYLPLAWLAEAGVDPQRLVRRPRAGAALAGVVRRLLAEADRLYRRADGGIARLPADCQVAIRAARLIYAEIGAQVARADFDAVDRRAVVPGWRKAVLLARAVAPLPATDADAPPLPAIAFLVDATARAQPLPALPAPRMDFANPAAPGVRQRRAPCSHRGSCRASSHPHPNRR